MIIPGTTSSNSPRRKKGRAASSSALLCPLEALGAIPSRLAALPSTMRSGRASEVAAGLGSGSGFEEGFSWECTGNGASAAARQRARRRMLAEKENYDEAFPSQRVRWRGYAEIFFRVS